MAKSMSMVVTAAIVFAAGGVRAADVSRTYAGPTAPIARAVTVPAGYDTVYLSGILPDLPAAPGGAEEQATSVFSKIGAALKSEGVSERDVVSMIIYMWAPAGARMDFDGMMKAYSKFYGTPAQPNRPARTTVQVANLGQQGALLEVAVTAVRKARK